MSPRKPKGNSSKKMMRLEKKKRKWQAFLDICTVNDADRAAEKAEAVARQDLTEDESDCETSNMEASKRLKIDEIDTNCNFTTVKTKKEEIEMDLELMRKKIRQRQKEKMSKPVFTLNEVGEKAKFMTDGADDIVPLVVADIQHLILSSLIGSLAPVRPRWCKLQHLSSVSGVVLLVVEGFSAEDYGKHIKCFKRIQTVFETVVKVIPIHQCNGNPIAELLWISIASTDQTALNGNEWTKLKKVSCEKPYRLFKVKSEPISLSAVDSVTDVFPRTYLLLSPEQMLIQGYPLVLPGAKPMADYVFTKEEYAKVSSYSPLFGIDCEMCLTKSGENELTRISIVNEKLEVIYDTLVKPRNKIVDYLTVYSGITEEKLLDVETRLEDVQNTICRLLPPDAILCGHSLNSDLHAMKMIHPYVIDTSFIYNLCGIRRKKPSLKNLSKTFLNESIQEGLNGHDSTEDSRSTLKLVQLKLRKSIDFGDVVACPTRIWKCREVKSKQEIFRRDGGFVTSLTGQVALQEKKVTVVSCSDLKGPEMPPELSSVNGSTSTNLFNLATNKEVVENVMDLAAKNHLLIAHLKVDSDKDIMEKNETSFFELDKYIKKIHNSLAVNSLFVVLFGGSSDNNSERNSEAGVCMIKLK